ncbi:uncharacterized protein DEA37_0009445 [Paragonimus westermani]|uniref:Uncharacterized protein n=1 Tax=Paragonimus westermani TaxID=34504 RepID=A0A5J4NWT5_9TREM|nr:uncharacterized protein DEA37_0009445 [Paragonimus westermani]
MQILRAFTLCVFCSITVIFASFALAHSPYFTEDGRHPLKTATFALCLIGLISFAGALILSVVTLFAFCRNQVKGIILLALGLIATFSPTFFLISRTVQTALFLGISYGLLWKFYHESQNRLISLRQIAPPTPGEWLFASVCAGFGLITIGIITLSWRDEVLDI